MVGGLPAGAPHAPWWMNVAPSASIAQRLPYVCSIGSHGVVMQTMGFEPQTGAYSFVQTIGPPPPLHQR